MGKREIPLKKQGKIKHYEIIKDYGGNDRLALIIV